ncbi:MAG TPA: cupin domain-containing protein [Candidatus Limnocylindrales bacterium]|nr:cupin domain-containing protein [Candidatus Limnocylindrales bacterium]
MSQPIFKVNPETVEVQPEPIPQDWILNGAPVARGHKLATSHDWLSTVVVWDCTAGRFTWRYGQDEVILVISGEAFLVKDNGEELRFGAGDVGYFRAGTVATWRVADYIRKVAIVRETTWRPLGLAWKVVKKLMRIVTRTDKSPF